MKGKTLLVRGLSSLARFAARFGEDQASPTEQGSSQPSAPKQNAGEKFIPIIYRQVPSFFTSSEGAFFLRLSEAVEGRCIVMSKVRLADLVQAQGDEQQRFKGFASVAQKHVDFVLLNPTTFTVIAAIELDGSTHFKGKQARRDESKARVLESAGIPLLRFSSLEVLPSAMIGERLKSLLSSDGSVVPPSPIPSVQKTQHAPTCRKCGKTMIQKTSERGTFWACPGFPKCWNTIPIKA